MGSFIIFFLELITVASKLNPKDSLFRPLFEWLGLRLEPRNGAWDDGSFIVLKLRTKKIGSTLTQGSVVIAALKTQPELLTR